MTTQRAEHRRNCRGLVLLLCGPCLLPLPVNAADTVTNPVLGALTPQTREAVQGVGRALLQAKRAYVAPQDTAALRESVLGVRELIVSLARPIATPTPIEVAGSGAAVTARQALAASLDWRQSHAGAIQRLRAATDELRQRSQALRARKSPSATTRSLIGTVLRFFTGAPEKAARGIVAPVTDVALTQLEQLDTEVASAIALPQNQRQARLQALAEALAFSDGRPAAADQLQTERMPTLTSRTRHRQ